MIPSNYVLDVILSTFSPLSYSGLIQSFLNKFQFKLISILVFVSFSYLASTLVANASQVSRNQTAFFFQLKVNVERLQRREAYKVEMYLHKSYIQIQNTKLKYSTYLV